MNVDSDKVTEANIVVDEDLIQDRNVAMETAIILDTDKDSDIIADVEKITVTDDVVERSMVEDTDMVTDQVMNVDSDKITEADIVVDEDLIQDRNVVTETAIILNEEKVSNTDKIAEADIVVDKIAITEIVEVTETDKVAVIELVEEINSDLNVTEGKDIVNINTIYFDFDKYNIRYDAKLELDKIAVVLKEYPEIEIDVNSHTDSRGKNSYNFILSDNRAKATVQYLVNKGIDPDRVSGKGHGELQLATDCPNGVPCTSFKHQLNRRSEFLIVTNGFNDVAFRSNSINVDNNDFTLNSGAYVNYNFDNNTAVFTVQVGAFQGKVQTNKYSKLTNLFNHRYDDGFNRYYAGMFETSVEARNYLKLLRKQGFKDAFIVGLKGNERM